VTDNTLPGGSFQLAHDLRINRLGFGAMQLAGPGVFGPPRDRDEAVAVLREAVALGINHIDTSDYYGPHVTNQIIREALSPFPESLCIVTKVGATRDAKGGWPHARSPRDIRDAIEQNRKNLGIDVIDVVNLRIGGGSDGHSPEPGSLEEPFSTLAELQREGKIKHLGVSTVSPEQIAQARSIAPIVCVQNFYNLAHRGDDQLIDELAAEGIAYTPYFPLGGFSPLQDQELHAVARRRGTSVMAVALAWLLQRSPNVLLIPGTSSVAHLRENVAGAALVLSNDDLAELDRIAG
jgi:aryl-alcohol dehydrogenase-like predicted oxidoreductase